MKLVIGVLMSLLFLCAPARADDLSTRDWARFRENHPFHFQAIAVSQPRGNGERTLIISEPPPHVTLSDLQNFDPALRDLSVETERIGTDGFVKDVVVDLPPLPPYELRELLDRLHVLLFYTSYKAWAVPIEAGPASSIPSLNLRVTASQLHDWLIRGNEQLLPASRSISYPLPTLLAKHRPGEYFSQTPGLVVLVLPKNADISGFKTLIRQFTLDSDLILGAVPGDTHLAVIARERQASIAVLPPLRVETVLLLASVQSSELSQSYERTNFLAGKLENKLDWAPIYLSEALIDTEYGSLLNITDQLLKSWTNHGQVTYEYFTYPAPPHFPFERPLGDILAATSLLYNWNTKGAGYSLQFGSTSTLALNRTGSLPVTYLPEGPTAEQLARLDTYEVKAYDTFSGLNDPNMVRVLQYAALYQIFRQYSVKSSEPVIHDHAHPEMDALASMTASGLQAFAAFDDASLRQRLRDRISGDYYSVALQKCQQLRGDLHAYAASANDPAFHQLGVMLANPRNQSAVRGVRIAVDRILDRSAAVQRDLHDALSRELLVILGFASPDRAREAYERAARRPTASWVKTPSFVLSTSRNKERISGGHNLDSKISLYETSATIPEGQIAIRRDRLGRRILVINDKDGGKLPAVLRELEVSPESEPALKIKIRRLLARAVPDSRPRAAVLGLENNALARTAPSERGLQPSQLPNASLQLGWQRSGQPVPPEYALSRFADAGIGSSAVAVQRNADFSYSVFFPGSNIPRIADTYDAAVDAIVQGIAETGEQARPWDVHFKGFEQKDASNFLKTVELQTVRGERLRLLGVARSDASEFKSVLRALNTDYDVARAKVAPPSVESITSGTDFGSEVLNMSLELPARVATRPSFLMRIRIFFRQTITENVKLAVENVVRTVLNRVTAKAAVQPAITGRDLILSIRRDLHTMGIPDENIRFDASGDWGDFFVAELVRSVGDRPPV